MGSNLDENLVSGPRHAGCNRPSIQPHAPCGPSLRPTGLFSIWESSSMSCGVRPHVSLCMIVKNEEHNLPACLTPIVGLFNEIVVLDTGSSDCTRQVARELGAVVV